MTEEGPSVSEVVCLLDSEIKYTSSGEERKSNMVVLYAPSAKQLRHTSKLQQMFYHSLPEFKEEVKEDANSNTDETDKKKESPDHSSIIGMVAMGQVDLYEFLEEGMKLLKSEGIAKVNGEDSLRDGHIEQMTPDDLQKLVGNYVANFIVASLMKQE